MKVEIPDELIERVKNIRDYPEKPIEAEIVDLIERGIWQKKND
jgi:hypothetical protein